MPVPARPITTRLHPKPLPTLPRTIVNLPLAPAILRQLDLLRAVQPHVISGDEVAIVAKFVFVVGGSGEVGADFAEALIFARVAHFVEVLRDVEAGARVVDVPSFDLAVAVAGDTAEVVCPGGQGVESCAEEEDDGC